jgi:preprotein translocase subunit YajC
MPFPAVVVTAVTVATSSSKTSSSSGSLIGYLPIIVIVGAFYLLFIRPRSRQAQQQRQLLADVGPGDEVLTGAGIFGTVLDIEGDRVTIETAPGTRLTVLRSTISRRLEPTTVADVVDADLDGEHSWDDEDRVPAEWEDEDGDTHHPGDEPDSDESEPESDRGRPGAENGEGEASDSVWGADPEADEGGEGTKR